MNERVAIEARNAADLVSAGIVRIAAEPRDNREDPAAAPAYTVALLADDYPALTPAMWNAAYRALGMPERNITVVANPEHAAASITALRRDPKYRGGGCGVGFKGAVILHLDELTPLARAMGAVNIVKNAPAGHLAGDNTDGEGFARAIEQRFLARDTSLQGKHILILGAGETAVPIGAAVARHGAEVTFLNRTESKAEAAAAAVNQYLGYRAAIAGGRHLIPTFLPTADAVVAAIFDREDPAADAYSPLGEMPRPVTAEAVAQNLAASMALLKSAKTDLIVTDVRLRREPPALVAQASALGLEAFDGKPMVIEQAIEAFWWLHGEMLERTGRTKAEVATIMREAAR